VITAVDSSVLLDVLLEDPRHRDASLAALRVAHRGGAVPTPSCAPAASWRATEASSAPGSKASR
jgi:hypothetical protein